MSHKLHRYLSKTFKSSLNLRLLSRNFYSESRSLKSKYSYACGTGQEPLLDYTLGKCLDVTAGKYPEKEAVVVCHQNIRKTYEQFKTDVDHLASGFIALGLKRGERIGIWSTNNYQWVLTQFASAKAGLILVCINPGYQKGELEYCMKKVELNALILAETFKTQNFYRLLESVIPTLPESQPGNLKDDRIPHLKYVIMLSSNDHGGAFKFDDIMNLGTKSDISQLEDLKDKIQFDDPVNIQFTSGTTGSPKGATLTHHNIVNNGYLFGIRLEYNKKHHRICIPAPMYHCIGNVLGTTAAVVHGACAVLPSPIFKAAEVAKAIQNEKATSIYGTPTMFIDILNLPDFDKYDFKSLETGIMAGSPCPTEIIKATMEKMNAKKLTIAYGCTETSPVVLQTFPNDSFDVRTSTVGSVLDFTEVKIVNPQDEIVPRGMQGEIWTRGYLVMLGYWNDPQKTEESITTSRWYKTGDLASMDENGNIKIVGRIKDMVIRGGENIYPREIEEILHTHENIAEVQVVGVPDKRMGEELCAWIKIKSEKTLSVEQVKDFCKGKIAHFKVPRYILFVDEFPITVTGKIQKFVMREKSIERLKL